MTAKNKSDLMESISGKGSNMVTLNKNDGTVTMDYRTYYLLHHDSLMLGLLITCPERKAILEALEEFQNDGITGKGFTVSHSPMTDVDAICYVYGVKREFVEQYFSEEEANA